jgi:hypothetical protein
MGPAKARSRRRTWRNPQSAVAETANTRLRPPRSRRPARSVRDTASASGYCAGMLKKMGDPLVQAAVGGLLITLLGALALKLLI